MWPVLLRLRAGARSSLDFGVEPVPRGRAQLRLSREPGDTSTRSRGSAGASPSPCKRTPKSSIDGALVSSVSSANSAPLRETPRSKAEGSVTQRRRGRRGRRVYSLDLAAVCSSRNRVPLFSDAHTSPPMRGDDSHLSDQHTRQTWSVAITPLRTARAPRAIDTQETRPHR